MVRCDWSSDVCSSDLLALRVFGPERDEVTGEWRKLHNEELNDLYSTQYCSGDKIENEMDGVCSVYGGEERHKQGFGGET
jgi:hypothetical protein